MLEIHNLTKDFHKKKLFQEINLTFSPEIHVLIGLNGSGKSTLLRIIAGLEQNTTGEIHLNSKNISQLPPEERKLGYVPQKACLFPHLTVFENVSYSLRNKQGNGESVKEAMELLQIKEYGKAYPHELSGGFQSRVALARALAANPLALLLDEPLSDIDLAIKEKLLPEFKKILQTRNIPVIYVTHDFQEATKLGEKFFCIAKQSIIAVENPEKAFTLLVNELSGNTSMCF